MTIDRPRFRLQFISKGLQQILLWSVFLFTSVTAQAQLTPDGTLGAESSRVAPRVLGGDQIEGGAIRGANLFHSFSEFNVRDQQRVYFANPTGVQNILTRVTGSTLSNINGTLGVDGAANLFLLNPNGIIFGQNARLDVRGSFVGSTANGIGFGNQGEFSATNPQTPSPLLTVQPSSLLFTQLIPGKIVSNSVSPVNKSPGGFDLFGLRVPDGQNLLLIGGDVQIDGGGESGGIHALGGRVELGGLASPGVIGLDSQFRLTFPDVINRSNLSLTNTAQISVRGGGSGNIFVNANSVLATNASRLSAGTEGSENAGDIVVNANMINLSGSTPDFAGGFNNQPRGNSAGNGGNIIVNTNELALSGGATLDTRVFGRGNAGNIIVNARDTITADSTNSTGSLSGMFANVRLTGQGNAGDINVTTGSLFLTNGGQLASATFGKGDAGNITVNARDIVTINGVSSTGFLSGIFANVQATGQGNAGDINVTTGSLFLTNGGQLASATFGKGDAGNITVNARDIVAINGESLTGFLSGIFTNVELIGQGNAGDINVTTSSLFLTNGGQLASATFGKGDAGNITVNARDIVAISGVSSNILPSGLFVTVESTGVGQAGNISLNTSSLSLSDRGTISAQTSSGEGGNIQLAVRNLLLLRQNSKISTTAGTVESGGNGGDISISSGFIVAPTKEDSDITANAFTGRGGNVQISAKAIFGIQVRSEQTSESDITASSRLGVQGNITINQPTVQPTQGVLELPTETLDASNQIAQVCPRGSAGQRIGRFVVSGTGSLPPNPIEPLTGSTSIPLATIDGSPNTSIATTPTPADSEIVEAQGWIKTADGKVALVAYAPDTTPSARPTATCSTVTQQ